MNVVERRQGEYYLAVGFGEEENHLLMNERELRRLLRFNLEELRNFTNLLKKSSHVSVSFHSSFAPRRQATLSSLH
uniref:Uncharacterized protein n=1 Tax=Lepeophtheirus salmonis TaxID=72036 RepID=A0A0K2UA99_LEPSM